MYGVAEDLRIWHILFLPDRIWNHQLKEKYIQQFFENKSIQVDEEKQRIKHILGQYDKYLEVTHKLDFHISSFSPSSSNIENIWDIRYKLYKNILSDENLNIKEKNPNLYRNLNDYVTWEDVFLDWDEELKVFLLEEKVSVLKNLPEIEEKLDGENAYRNLRAAKNYFQKRMMSENTDTLSFLDVPLYNYMEAFEQDYLKSVYLDQEFDVWKVNGFLKFYEFIRGDFEYTDIKEYIELIWWTFNGARWLSWRTLKLWTDIMKSVNAEIIYDIWIWEDGLVEWSMRYMFAWEKYIDNASLNQFIKGSEWTVLMAPALASGIIDGYMDAAATIWMFIAEPEQLIRDMKKVPELLKHIDIQELYALYAETFDGKPEELYPAIMYTLAYIYVLMIAMPLAAPNLVSKVGELVGKVIGKGKFRKELKELEGEKLKLKEMKEEYSFMNEWKTERDIVYKELENGNNKIDKSLEKRKLILGENRELMNSIILMNKKEKLFNIKIRNQKNKKSIKKERKKMDNKIDEYYQYLQISNYKLDSIQNEILLLIAKEKYFTNKLNSVRTKLIEFNNKYGKELWSENQVVQVSKILELKQLSLAQRFKVERLEKALQKDNVKLDTMLTEINIEKQIIEQKRQALFTTQKEASRNKLADELDDYMDVHNSKIILLDDFRKDMFHKNSLLDKEKGIQGKYDYEYDSIYTSLSLQNYENYVIIKSNNIEKKAEALSRILKGISEKVWKSLENTASRLNDTRSILEDTGK